jgi:hypothetical protein
MFIYALLNADAWISQAYAGTSKTLRITARVR